MKKEKQFFLVLALMIALLHSGCTSQKKLVYLQGDASLLKDTTTFQMKLYPGDIIAVELYTVNPDAFPGLGMLNSHPVTGDNRSAYEKGFVLDKSGNVSLPYVGAINLAGLKLEDAHDTIVGRFRTFIDEPIITLKKLSFKVSIIGEVNRPGLYYIPNEQLTILEAIALAGDLTNYANRTDLKILRKSGDGVIEIPVDFTSKTAFTGASKYIYPDDIVYVPPTRKKAFTSISPATQVLTSLITTLVLVAALYIRK